MPAPPADEPLIPVNDAAVRLGVGRHSVVRWFKRGVVGPDGSVVRLGGWRVGGTWKTTRSAINAFLAAMNRDAQPPAAIRSPTAVRRASDRAERELIARGV
ncbi:MAG TPA: helix-turn-helix domain-containing protein [Urbifossiella sp.]|jgi:hypothetical protein|nr:helix-turn-helix domain-containing protein [Urbifossiella sp.]